MIRAGIGVAAAAALAVACGRDDAPPPAQPAAPSSSVTPRAAAPARTEPGGRRHVVGRVVDASSGTPLGDARVIVAGRAAGGVDWIATRTSADGSFDVPLTRAGFADDAEMALRVRADGFRPWRGTVGAGPADVRLEALARDLVPGRVAGVALDADGKPISGTIGVAGFDEDLEPLRRTALADAAGAFALEGVPPGTWSLALPGDGPRSDVVVPEDGEGRVELRSAAPHADSVVARVAALERSLAEARVAGDADAIARMQDALRSEIAAAQPQREVVVRGLGAAPRAWASVDAVHGPWVVEVRGGEARFPALPPGPARVRVQRLDAIDVEFAFEVAAGEGGQVVDAGR